MQWPWVSRERLLEAIAVRDSQIAKLEKERSDLEKERRRLLDFIAVRSNGISIYGEIKPPREDEPEPEPDGKDIGELKAIPPTRARSFQRAVEERNMAAFKKENEEAERLVAEMQEAGRRAAEAKSNDHSG